MAARPLAIGIDGRELAGRPTGTGRYLRSLLRQWREGRDRLLVYFNGPAPADPVLSHPAVEVRALGDGHGRGLTWQELELAPAARADGVDVLFCPAYSCPLSFDGPRVTAVHDLSFFGYPQDFGLLDGLRRRLTVAASLRGSSRVLVCSDFTRRELARLFPHLAGRARLVPLGPDDDLPPGPSRSEARARLSLSGPSVINVGAILNRRCLPELLRATARLDRHHPDLRLDVIGENRTMPRLDLPDLARRLGLGGRVGFSGFVDEAGLADRYAAADVAVFLSEYEGFGLPAIEAAARGVPLVVSHRPSLCEIFGGAALVVDPRDEAAVALAIHRLLTQPALRARLVEAGRALARGHSWARTATLTRAVLEEAAAS